METPYIGASISLISKSEIRYEGILFTIDTKESNIALQNGALLVCGVPAALRRCGVPRAPSIWRPPRWGAFGRVG